MSWRHVDPRFDVEAMLDDLRQLVSAESPSSDVTACRTCAATLESVVRTRLPGASTEVQEHRGRPSLVVRTGGPARVLLVGHLDTVWPLGSLARLPFRVDDERVFGPGVFDMKGGLVLGVHALAALGTPAGVTMVVTSDEEVGSAASVDLLHELTAGMNAAIVLEPAADGPDGSLKVGRKGVSLYRLVLTGRAAHAGMNPGGGVNTTLELAQLVPRIAALSDIDGGTTVTPTLARSGTAANVVPAEGELHVDVRVTSRVEQDRVDAAMRALRVDHPEARLRLEGGPNRLPLPVESTAVLSALAREVAADLGIGPLGGEVTGGASDANLLVPLDVPLLDGIGPVGGGGHTDDEHLDATALVGRGALLAGVVERILART